ncbi:tripartite tricarboxylate transporter TctB family protein [Phaeovulum sp.]|uniref:tripartite tricarboxylate transporter TctB family protein n=1 Tax=Phaeovulum sp. TaxID=2934796 RepID=UPI0039E5BDBF
MASDRIFGLVVIAVALAFIASALAMQVSFLTDPVGSKTFPLIIGGVALLAGFVIVLKPDADPDWPGPATFLRLAFALLVLIGYAYTLRPFGFLIPTALAAGVLSYQITPQKTPAVLTGAGLSGGLFLLFKYGLDLGLVALPKSIFG